METKQTPGQERWSPDHDNRTNEKGELVRVPCVSVSEIGPGGIVCETRDYGTAQHIAKVHNSHYDLLAACEAAVDWIRGGYSGEAAATLEWLEAAISAAKGGE